MKKINKIYLLLAALALSGCDETFNSSSVDRNVTIDTSFEKDTSDMFTNRDYDTSFDSNGSINIYLNKTSISCNSNKVEIEGTTVKIKDEGTYIISGQLDNGKIIVEAEESDKPQLVFDGVKITNSSFAPLYIIESDKVFITLVEGSTNELVNNGSFVQIDSNNVDGAIFSKQDLTINGKGVLNVKSSYGHGIVCKDDLVFTSGTYSIDALNHGIDANDSVRMNDTTLHISSGKDGIHCENDDDTALGYIFISNGIYEINAKDDGISSSSSIQIEDGTFNIKTGSNYTTDNTSLKAIKATSSMMFNGGTFEIDSYDDAIHSNNSIIINGGAFSITTNDDGFHADETLSINNGSIDIKKSYEGLEALTINVTGGTINIVASDDGINAAGGTDSSGYGNDNMPGYGGGKGGRPGDNFGGNSNSSSNGYIEISGGNINIKASGDGIDANGSLLISGGIVRVCGPTTGDTAVLDYDKTGIISGGEFYGTGASMMAQSLSGSGQGVIGINVGNKSAGTSIIVKNSSGEEVATITPELSYQIVIISNPKIVKGDSYTVTIGSSSSKVTAK